MLDNQQASYKLLSAHRASVARWPFLLYACVVQPTGSKPDAQMFYVTAERRFGGKLRKMYLRYASDTSIGGHILSTMHAERSYNERHAKVLLASSAREFPEWGLALEPVLTAADSQFSF